MGTRHLTKVTYQGKNVIAQYGQWDGYPTGQGVTVGEFLSSRHYVDKLKENAERGMLVFLTEDEVTALEEAVFKEHADTNVGGALKSIYRSSQFHRDCGAKVLWMAARVSWLDGKFYCEDASSFENDHLFCEFVHHLDWTVRPTPSTGPETTTRRATCMPSPGPSPSSRARQSRRS